MQAKVIGWTGGNQADLFCDEYGGLWAYAVAAADGTIAVEEVPDGERQEPVGRAGVFESGQEGAEGEIYPKADGATYGVNCQDEYVAQHGRWVLAEEEEEAVQS
jgi:hypothetical protein